MVVSHLRNRLSREIRTRRFRLGCALAFFCAVPANGVMVRLSSSTLGDIHKLEEGTIKPSSSLKPLTRFPENLIYAVSWGPLAVGQADLGVQELVLFSSRPAYHIVSHAHSNKFCDAFYQVRDVNESWLDAETFNSLGYSKNLREGRFYRDEWVAYDSSRRRFLAKMADRNGHYLYKEGTLPSDVQDILSSLYYIRSKDLKPGQGIILNVNTKKNWPLVVNVTRTERITTPAGTFDTILVEPKIRREGIFIQKGKDLRIWMTQDPAHVPVRMEVEIFFGHVTAKLIKMVP